MSQQHAEERGSLDGHGIFAVIVFAAVSILCIVPLRIPLPTALSQWLRLHWSALCVQLGFSDANRTYASRTTPGTDGEGSPVELKSSEQTPQANNQVASSVARAQAQQRPSQSQRPPSVEIADVHAPTTPPDRVYIPLTHVTAPVLGVLLLLATVTITGAQVRAGIAGEGDVYPYDVLLLFICLAYIAISLDASGLLRYLACHVCQRAAFDGRLLYMSLYGFLWLAGVILGNDPVIISGTAFLVYLTRVAGISPASAWIWAQFVAANVASAVLVSSNPTNLVIATGFEVSFVSYTAYMALPSLVGAVASLAALMLFFGTMKQTSLLSGAVAPDETERVDSTRRAGQSLIPKSITKPDIAPRLLLVDPFGAVFSSVVMLAVIGTMVGTSVSSHIKVFQIGLPGAALCMVRHVVADVSHARKQTMVKEAENRRTSPLAFVGHGWRKLQRWFPSLMASLRRLPLALLPFAFGMFILVQALNHVGFVTIMARGLGRVCKAGVAATTFFMAFLSIVLCNFGGTNIGATILLTKVMQSDAFKAALEPGMEAAIIKAGMYAVAFGSNLGALGGTFAASLAGLLWDGVLSDHGIKVTSLQFAIWCLVAVLPAAGAGLGTLLAELMYFKV